MYGTTNEPDISCRQLAEVRFCIVIPVELADPEQSFDWPEVFLALDLG